MYCSTPILPSLVTHSFAHLVHISVNDLQIICSTSSRSNDVTAGTKPANIQKLSVLIMGKWNHFYQAPTSIIPYLHKPKKAVSNS